MKYRIVGFLLMEAFILAHSPAAQAQSLPSLQSDLTKVESEIKAAEAEDARYSGGLVKALTGSTLAILRQTSAMLEQKSLAAKHGASLTYTVDGKLFSPPAGASQTLAAVSAEIAANDGKIRDQEATAAQYTGGLTQAMALSALETLRHTKAMLEQRRLALRYGLPQYVAFNAGNSSQPAPAAAKIVAATEPSAAKPERAVGDLRSVALRVTKKEFELADPSAGKYYDLILFECSYRNIATKDIRAFTGVLAFSDLFGNEIYRAKLVISDPVAAGQVGTWTGEIRYNQFVEAQQRFRNSALDDMKVSWTQTAVIFADGSKAGTL